MQLKDVFLAKLDMFSASFLHPVAFGLFDAYDPTQDMSVLPLTSHAGSRISGCSSLNHTMCLRPPIRQDPRAGEAFRCQDPASVGKTPVKWAKWINNASDKAAQTSKEQRDKDLKPLADLPSM